MSVIKRILMTMMMMIGAIFFPVESIRTLSDTVPGERPRAIDDSKLPKIRVLAVFSSYTKVYSVIYHSGSVPE